MDFTDVIFLVTGASKGIGKSLCTILEEHNARVIKVYNNTKIDDENSYKCDLSSEDEIKELYEKVKLKYKKIDVLINCAAYANDNLYMDKTHIEFNKTLQVNVTGTFLMIKYFSNIIDKGVIINVSSLDGISSYNEYNIDYAASKAAVINMTKNFSKILKNIKVCAIAPAWVDTLSTLEIERHYLEDSMKENGQEKLLKKEDVALKIIEMVINNDDYVTGDIVVMGGKNE